MSDFKAKMHQIVCQWGRLQRSPDPSWILGGLLLREGRGRKGRRGEGPCSPVTPPATTF